MAATVIVDHVPLLIAEVRHLQEELRSRDDSLAQANEGYEALRRRLQDLEETRRA